MLVMLFMFIFFVVVLVLILMLLIIMILCKSFFCGFCFCYYFYIFSIYFFSRYYLLLLAKNKAGIKYDRITRKNVLIFANIFNYNFLIRLTHNSGNLDFEYILFIVSSIPIITTFILAPKACTNFLLFNAIAT